MLAMELTVHFFFLDECCGLLNVSISTTLSEESVAFQQSQSSTTHGETQYNVYNALNSPESILLHRLTRNAVLPWEISEGPAGEEAAPESDAIKFGPNVFCPEEATQAAFFAYNGTERVDLTNTFVETWSIDCTIGTFIVSSSFDHLLP